MPLDPAYDKLIDSPIADMKNIGGSSAGSITAAQFLKRFTHGVTWAHLDVAGMVWSDKSGALWEKRAMACACWTDSWPTPTRHKSRPSAWSMA